MENKLFFILFNVLITPVIGYAQFSSSLNNKISLWLNCDSIFQNDSIFIVNSIEGRNIKFFQTDSSIFPSVINHNSSINGKKSLNLDNDILLCDSSIAIKEVFAVAKWKNNWFFNSYNGLLTAQTGGAGDILFIGNVNSSRFFNQGFFGGNIFLNQVLNSDSNNLSKYFLLHGIGNSSKTFQDLIIGRDRNFIGRNWKGEICEIICIDSSISPSEKNELLSFFQNKYCPPIIASDTIEFNYGFCQKSESFYQEWFTSYFWSTGTNSDSIKINPPSKSYFLTVTDIFNNTSSKSIFFKFPEIKNITQNEFCYTHHLTWSTQMPHTYNFLWQDGSTDSTLTISQPGDYWVQITDSFGCSITSDTVHIEVDSFAVQASLGADRSLCQGNRLELQEGRAEAENYQWSTGDTLPYLTIQNPGTYAVTTTNSLGCVAEDTVTIGIKGLAPTPQFSKQNACLGDSVSFTDQSVANSGNIIQWIWDFGDGTTDSVQHPSHLYIDTGYFEVNLTVLTDSGCEASMRDTVIIFPNPVAHFSVGASCERLETQFTDSSFSTWDSIISWNWNFGDGTTSTQPSLSHIYNSPQPYQAQLRVMNANGCEDSLTKQVNTLPSPIAQLNYSPPCVNDSVLLSDASIGQNIQSRQWTLWNGFSFSGTQLNQVFTQTGQFPIFIQVTDSNGCFDTLTTNIPIRNHPVIPNPPSDTIICLGDSVTYSIPLPTNHFSFLWSNGSADSSISLSTAGVVNVQVTDSVGCATTSSNAQLSLNSYPQTPLLGNDTIICKGEEIQQKIGLASTLAQVWFNNDSSNTVSIDSTGFYSITAFDTMGCVAIDTALVTIKGEAANVQFNWDSTCVFDSTQFYDQSLLALGDTIIQWEWQFGNGLIDSIQHPKTFFPSVGAFSVILNTITNDGCFATKTDTLSIFNRPNPSFSTTLSCEGRITEFQDQSTDPSSLIVLRQWQFGDANNSSDTGKSTAFTYNQVGQKIVFLTVENSLGCDAQTSQVVNVNVSPLAGIETNNACLGTPLTFNSNSTFNNPTLLFWDFGNGVLSQGSQVTQLFDSVGTYPITHIIQNANGCRDTAKTDVTIFSNPSAKATVGRACVGAPVGFSDISSSSDIIISRNWTIEGVQDSGTSTYVKTFEDSGFVAVALRVKTDKGCKDSVSTSFKIHGNPIANFEIQPEFGAAPLEVSFTNSSSQLFKNIWYINDSLFSEEIAPDFTFLENGTFTIQLFNENNFGCSDLVSKQIKVLEPVLDLRLISVSTEIIENRFIQATIRAENRGTRVINSFEVILTDENGNSLKETIDRTINVGETTVIPLNAQLDLGSEGTTATTCATLGVVNNERLDDDQSNDRACFSQETFLLQDLFPNPTSNTLNIEFILGEADHIVIDVLNREGKSLGEVYKGEGNKGFNYLSIPIQFLNQGNYFIRITYRNNQQVKSFTKAP